MSEARDVRGVFEGIAGAAPTGAGLFGKDGKALLVNALWTEVTGVREGDYVWESGEGTDSRRVRAAWRQAQEEGSSPPVEVRTRGGGRRGRVCLGRVGGEGMTAGYVEDVGEKREMEQEFAHLQKLRAVGQLAGGVAHDFNNLLTGIRGFCDLLREKGGGGGELEEIRKSAERGERLVGQLLAFSRRQRLEEEALSFGGVLRGMEELLRRTLGERLEVEVEVDDGDWLVWGDKGQLERAVMNLAVNARDATLGGGVLRLRTYGLGAGEMERRGHVLARLGEYVCCEVRDEGEGIAREHIGRIFEPFFTTKGGGETGAGLGLSTTYGIVKQLGGYIFPESELGVGTTFRIYLPRYEGEVVEGGVEEEARVLGAGEGKVAGEVKGACILLVEDDESVRTAAAAGLRGWGYKVVEASGAAEALEHVRSGLKVDVLLTDVALPGGVDGPELVRILRGEGVDLKVVYISGYMEEAYRRGGGDSVFLSKPFGLEGLRGSVGEALGKGV